MKSMILAAGYGTRLKPYTDNIPKALVKHNDSPMINMQIDRLMNAGVTEIIINAHHHHDKLISYMNERDFRIKVNIIIEDEILGTGGGILNAYEYFKNEDYFYVINVDVDTDFDINEMKFLFVEKNPLSVIAVQKRISARKLEFTDEMQLTGRQNENSDKNKLFAFNGIHLISNKIFRNRREKTFADIFDVYFEDMKNYGGKVYGKDTGETNFKDLGRIENI